MKRFAKRDSLGQGVIGLSALVGLILIPVIGIFAFEVARYQYGVQQLESNTDSAALAGAAMLVTSRFQKPADRMKRFEEATAAAENAFKSTYTSTSNQLNIILGSTLKSSRRKAPGSQLVLGSNVGDCEYKVEAVDPATLQVVDPTQPNAKAIRFTALFTGRPAFGRFLGLNQLVPVFSKSTAGVPVLDVVVCFDVSGSMDDSTRVSLVNRKWTIPEPQRSQIAAAWEDYVNAKNNYENGIDNGTITPENCPPIRQSVRNKFAQYLDLRKTLGAQHGKTEWSQVHYGTLHDCVFSPLNPSGSSINCLFPQNLNIINYTRQTKPPANPNLQIFNCAERHFQETGNPNVISDKDKCTDWSQGLPAGTPSTFSCACPPNPPGITDLVVHCDNQINTQPQQPIFASSQIPIPLGPGARFTYTKKRNPFKGSTYAFDGVGYLVEASRGNLEPSRFNDLKNSVFKNNIIAGELPAQGQAGYQAAYQEMAGKFCQPMAATIEALENFYQALQGAGTDVQFGLVAYETKAGNRTPPSVTEIELSDIANKDPNTPNCQFDVNSSSPGPPGPKKRPILYMKLDKLIDPENDLIEDPTDPSKPKLSINDAFESYLVGLRATNIAASLREALKMLDESGRKVYARQVVLLITDGVATRDIDGNPSVTQGYADSRNQAKLANEAGVPIFTVGVAQNPPVEAQQLPFLGDETTPAPQGLATLSGNGAKFFSVNRNSIIAPGGGQVNAISQAFLQVARSLVQLIE